MDTLLITVSDAVSNTVPTVDAGVDETLDLQQGSIVTLNGVVSDDGLPATGTLSSNWSVVSAPTGATVLFTDATLAQTSVSVDVVGIYELELSANDGELSAVDTMLITVIDGSLDPQVLLRINGGGGLISQPGGDWVIDCLLYTSPSPRDS